MKNKEEIEKAYAHGLKRIQEEKERCESGCIDEEEYEFRVAILKEQLKVIEWVLDIVPHKIAGLENDDENVEN